MLEIIEPSDGIVNTNKYKNAGEKFMSIFVRQYQRKLLIKLLRAFKKWAIEFPLIVKCEEIGHQLTERTLLLETVRNSYLKDVVSVKHYLDQLDKIDFDKINTKEWKETFYDLHAVPSTDVRLLVEKARKMPGLSSIQLRDNLVECGLIDSETLKTENPWEHSRSFRRYCRLLKGPTFNYPTHLNGECIDVTAPTNFKVYVRHCTDCIGMVSFVKSWNDTIEEAIRFKVEYAAIDTKIEDFKKLINNLQDIIIAKDKDVQDLTHKLQVYEETNHWFLKWTNVKNFQQFKDFYEEKIFNLQNTILMLLEEKSSMATHLYGKFDEKLLLCLDNEKQLMKKISLLQEQIQQEISMREKLSAEYQQLVLENLSLKTDKQKAGALENELNAKIETLQSRVSYLESENHQLQDLLNEKDNIFNNYKRQMNAKLEDMEQTISKYESDLDKYEQINFGLKQDIKDKQGILAKQAKEIESLEKTIEELEKELYKYRFSRRRTFKSYAIAVRCVVRIFRALQSGDYSLLGALGHRLVSAQRNQRNTALSNDLRNAAFKYKELSDKNTELNQENVELREQLMDLRGLLNQRQGEYNDLCDKFEESQDMIKLLQTLLQNCEEKLQHLREEYEKEKEYLKNKFSGDFQLFLTRIKIFGFLQRNLSKKFHNTFATVKGLIEVMDLPLEIKHLYRDIALMNDNEEAGVFAPVMDEVLIEKGKIKQPRKANISTPHAVDPASKPVEGTTESITVPGEGVNSLVPANSSASLMIPPSARNTMVTNVAEDGGNLADIRNAVVAHERTKSKQYDRLSILSHKSSGGGRKKTRRQSEGTVNPIVPLRFVEEKPVVKKKNYLAMFRNFGNRFINILKVMKSENPYSLMMDTHFWLLWIRFGKSPKYKFEEFKEFIKAKQQRELEEMERKEAEEGEGEGEAGKEEKKEEKKNSLDLEEEEGGAKEMNKEESPEEKRKAEEENAKELALQEKKLKEDVPELSIQSLYQADLKQINDFSTNVIQDVFVVHSLIAHMKSHIAYYKKQMVIMKDLEVEYQDLLKRFKKMESTMEHNSILKSKRQQMLKVRTSNAHLLGNDVGSYLQNVIAAIDTVKDQFNGDSTPASPSAATPFKTTTVEDLLGLQSPASRKSSTNTTTTVATLKFPSFGNQKNEEGPATRRSLKQSVTTGSVSKSARQKFPSVGEDGIDTIHEDEEEEDQHKTKEGQASRKGSVQSPTRLDQEDKETKRKEIIARRSPPRVASPTAAPEAKSSPPPSSQPQLLNEEEPQRKKSYEERLPEEQEAPSRSEVSSSAQSSQQETPEEAIVSVPPSQQQKQQQEPAEKKKKEEKAPEKTASRKSTAEAKPPAKRKSVAADKEKEKSIVSKSKSTSADQDDDDATEESEEEEEEDEENISELSVHLQNSSSIVVEAVKPAAIPPEQPAPAVAPSPSTSAKLPGKQVRTPADSFVLPAATSQQSDTHSISSSSSRSVSIGSNPNARRTTSLMIRETPPMTREPSKISLPIPSELEEGEEEEKSPDQQPQHQELEYNEEEAGQPQPLLEGGDSATYDEEDEEDSEESSSQEGKEDEHFINELELHRQEAMAFLQRETELGNQISQLTSDNTFLTDQVNYLQEQVAYLTNSNGLMSSEMYQLKSDLHTLTEAYDKLSDENDLLREIVQNEYKYHHDKVNQLIDNLQIALEKKEKEKLLRKRLNKRNRGTQIACSVCAIQEFYDPNKPHRHPGAAGPGAWDDDQTIAQIHEQMAKVLGEEKILIPTRFQKPPSDQEQPPQEPQEQQQKKSIEELEEYEFLEDNLPFVEKVLRIVEKPSHSRKSSSTRPISAKKENSSKLAAPNNNIDNHQQQQQQPAGTSSSRPATANSGVIYFKESNPYLKARKKSMASSLEEDTMTAKQTTTAATSTATELPATRNSNGKRGLLKTPISDIEIVQQINPLSSSSPHLLSQSAVQNPLGPLLIDASATMKDGGDQYERSKNLLKYARTLMNANVDGPHARPKSALPTSSSYQQFPSTTAASSPAHFFFDIPQPQPQQPSPAVSPLAGKSSRPSSAYHREAGEVLGGDESFNLAGTGESSKFRKIKQMPQSHSTQAIQQLAQTAVQNSLKSSLSHPILSQISLRLDPTEDRDEIQHLEHKRRNLLGNDRDRNVISNTAAFLQEHQLYDRLLAQQYAEQQQQQQQQGQRPPAISTSSSAKTSSNNPFSHPFLKTAYSQTVLSEQADKATTPTAAQRQAPQSNPRPRPQSARAAGNDYFKALSLVKEKEGAQVPKGLSSTNKKGKTTPMNMTDEWNFEDS